MKIKDKILEIFQEFGINSEEKALSVKEVLAEFNERKLTFDLVEINAPNQKETLSPYSTISFHLEKLWGKGIVKKVGSRSSLKYILINPK